MSQSTNQSLQFSINESVWLRDGEEAEDILSMALDPDITIEETPHYVSIKGALRLSGEYKPVEAPEDAEDRSIGDDERPSFRTIDEITETDVGTSLLEHRFPVDITIPASRVREIEDVYVTIESFDYDLPEKGCIQLQAEVAISGLVDQTPEREDEGSEDTEGVDEETFDPRETETYESYREAEDPVESRPNAPQIGMKRRQEKPEEDLDDASFPVSALRYQDLNDEDDESIDVYQESAEEEEEPLSVAYRQAQPESYDEVEEDDDDEDAFDENDYDEDDDEADEGIVRTKRREENALYLTKMLTNEEDQFSRVKMCIVQGDESLESISDRYEVPITSILRRNRLDSDVLDEGQVLYIPVASKG